MGDDDQSTADSCFSKDIFSESSPDTQTEGFLSTLALDTDLGLVSIDSSSNIVFVNPGIEQILGYKPTELIDSAFETVVSTELDNGRTKTLDDVFHGDVSEFDSAEFQFIARHASGRDVPVRVTFHKHRYNDQTLLTGIVRNQTEQMSQWEDLLQYKRIISELPIGIFRAEAHSDEKFLEVNPELCDILDVDSTEDLLELGLKDFYYDENKHEAFQEIFERKSILENEELKLRTAEDTIIWASVTAVEQEKQGQNCVMGVVEEITKERKQERELLSAKQSLETILSNIPGILFTFDKDGVFTRSEGQPLEQIGLQPGEAVGQSVFDLYEGHPEILECCQSALNGKQISHTSTVQGRIFETTYQPIVDNTEVTQVVGFAYDITEREQREQQLKRQQKSLRRVKQITESLRPLNRALAHISTRDEIEQTVCDHLAQSPPYQFAWYGSHTAEKDQVAAKARSGIPPEYIDSVIDAPSTDAFKQRINDAINTGTIETMQNIPTNSEFESWHGDSLSRGYQSAAAIPVVFGEAVYGAIIIYSSRPDAFDEYEIGLFRELGERVGHAIHSAENKQLLAADSVIELKLRRTTSPLISVASTLGCQIESKVIIPATDDSVVCYATISGRSLDTVVTHLSEKDSIEQPRTVKTSTHPDEIEYRMTDTLVSALSSHGAIVTEISVDNKEEVVVCEVAPDTNIANLLMDLQERYSTTELVSKHSITRSTRELDQSTQSLTTVLTPRQREVITLAYHAGFFESPRASTGSEIADSLGIASSTFYLHVRKAIQNILGEMDDSEMLS